MPQHSILKIKFSNTEVPKKIQEDGIRLFGFSYKPWQIEEEKYVLPTQCMKCFMYTHKTFDCPSTQVICSECSGNHHFRACDAKEKKCTQCGGKHRTFSGLCTKSKEAIKDF